MNDNDLSGKHPVTFVASDQAMTPPITAEILANMRYDALAKVLGELSRYLMNDAGEDHKRGRHKLAGYLTDAAYTTLKTSEHIREAWKTAKQGSAG
jgi:hypothetical protein